MHSNLEGHRLRWEFKCNTGRQIENIIPFCRTPVVKVILLAFGSTCAIITCFFLGTLKLVPFAVDDKEKLENTAAG